MARGRRILNSYSLERFQELCSRVGVDIQKQVETVVLAYGQDNGDGIWLGGFLLKIKPSSGYPRLAHIQQAQSKIVADRSTHILDFPDIPDNADKDPFVLNEYIEDHFSQDD